MKKYDTINNVDSEGVEELLQCLCEAITGLDWRMDAEPQTIDESDYEKIRKFTRRDFEKDELYVFEVSLCNNDVDRDNEKFSIALGNI